jgi:hypothetical protein
VFQDTASALFGVEGLRVSDVQAGPGGALEVWAVIDYPAAAACPDCGMISGRIHEMVLARPRDVRRAADPVDLRWVKMRRFTEWVPAVPPQCRITTRLREQAGAEVTERACYCPHCLSAPGKPLTQEYPPNSSRLNREYNQALPERTQTTSRSAHRADASPTARQGGQRGGAPGRLPRRCQRVAVLAPLARSGR